MAIYLFHGLIFASLPARRNLVSEFGGDCGGCYFGGGIHRNHLASLPTAFVAFTDWVTHIPMPLLQKIANFGFIGRLEKLRGVGQQKL